MGLGVHRPASGVDSGRDDPAREPFAPGNVCEGRYRILRRLNTSGAAVVYEAEHLFTGGRLALKALVDRAGSYHERMRLEARALAEVRHPNVIQVTDGGVTPDGIVWFATELLSGRTLREELRHTGALGVERAVRFGVQIAQGVAAAHALGIIHRDLKPENIFVVRADDTIRVLDFGLSKFTRSSLQTVDRFRLPGTEAYLSPEHLQADTVDERTDIYALGHILYEMIAGAHCLSASPGTLDLPPADELSLRQICEAPPPLVDRAPGTPDEVARCVHRALAKDRAARQPSMSVLAHELTAALTRPSRSGIASTIAGSPGSTARIPAAPRPASDAQLDARGVGGSATGSGGTVPVLAAVSGRPTDAATARGALPSGGTRMATEPIQPVVGTLHATASGPQDGPDRTEDTGSHLTTHELGSAPEVWSLAAVATLASVVVLGLALLLRHAVPSGSPEPEPVRAAAPTQ